MYVRERARTGRKKPEEVIGRGNVDWIAKATMSYFLSGEFQKYELLEEPLPTREKVKSGYCSSLLDKLRVRYGAALDDTVPPLGVTSSSEETQKQLGYVSRLPMAKKFDETVRDYAESILNSKYEAVASFLKELAAMTPAEQVLTVQNRRKKNTQQPAPSKQERRRGRINTKGQSYV